MDELTRLLTEVEPVPDAVWMRVVANALDPSLTQQDLADLLPVDETRADSVEDADYLLADDLLDDDPDRRHEDELDSLVWTEHDVSADADAPSADHDDATTDDSDPDGSGDVA